MDWYRDWFGTRYYALLYGHRDRSDAECWVRAIMDRWKPGVGDRLLDMACGRGRHALHFANAGLHVTGVDISEQSLAEARLAVPSAEFVLHDIREPLGGAAFPFVTCLFTSLGYTTDPADDQRILNAVADNLQPGGRFVLDVMNTARVLEGLVPTEDMEIGGVGFKVDRWFGNGVIHKRITVSDDGEERTYEERVRALWPEELTAMVTKAGLVVEEATDGPSFEPFHPQRSQRFVLWARKNLSA
jgi:SAM-dependent methyltransferase